MNITTIIAGYGAIAATAAALWNIRQYRSDRRLSVTMKIGRTPEGAVFNPLEVYIANSGKRQIKLVCIDVTYNWWYSLFRYKGFGTRVAPPKWPITLCESDSVTINAGYYPSYDHTKRLSYAILDSTHKRWKLRRRNFRKTIKRYHELVAARQRYLNMSEKEQKRYTRSSIKKSLNRKLRMFGD